MQSNDARAVIENPDRSVYDAKMDTRLSKIESDVVGLKIDVAVIRSNYVTKADLLQLKEELHRALHELTWKIYGFGAVLVSAVFFIARYVH